MGLFDRFMRRRGQEGGPRQERLLVLCAVVPNGVTGDDGIRLRDLFKSSNAIDWWFLNPRSFQAYFPADESGRAHALALTTELGRLKTTVGTLGELKVATAEGPLVVSRRGSGGFTSMPVGEVINRAMQLALKR
jgi:hypothetical protein